MTHDKPTTGGFTKTAGWLDWYNGPTKPTLTLPAGAVDAHCHVFGPGDSFPYAEKRKYTPCDASKDQLFALRDHLGFARNVIVQATCHGADNSAMVDALPTTVVVDHMGRPDVTQPVDGPEFALFERFMREHPNVWSKVTCPERLSVAGPKALNGASPTYLDVVPFAQRLIAQFPDRVLWGTDWPHPNLKDHMPDDGLLVEFIAQIAPDEATRQKLLVDNPMKLYWPEEKHGA